MDAITQQSMAPYRGTERVSGRAVPYSWGTGIGKLGQALIGAYGGKKVAEEEKALEQQYSEQRQKSMDRVISALQGTPEKPYELSQEEQFEGEQIPGLRTAEVAPDPQRAALTLGTDPYLQEGDLAERMLMNQALGTTGGARGFSKVIYDANGNALQFNTRTGETTPIQVGGEAVSDPRYTPGSQYGLKQAQQLGTGQAEALTDPITKGAVTQAQMDVELGMKPQIARATEEEKIKGEAKATAQVDAPATFESYEKSIGLIDELTSHPGFKDAVGFPDNPFTLGGLVPWTDAAGFRKRLTQLSGRGFMEVFPTLKGGGSITEPEGEKAQTAINRMSTALNEKEFLAASDDFKSELYRLKKVVADRAGVAPGPPPQTGKAWTDSDEARLKELEAMVD